MQCKYCGAKLSENAKFCGVCSNKVERETVKPKHNDPIPDKVHNTGNEKTDIFITEKETICTGKKRKVQME